MTKKYLWTLLNDDAEAVETMIYSLKSNNLKWEHFLNVDNVISHLSIDL